MVVLSLRQVAPGGTLAAARAHILQNGEGGYFVDTDGVRRFTIGDGVRTLGSFIDAGETFDVRGGLSILSGTGTPSDSLGRNGEQYYDRTSRTMWGPKAGGTWVGTSQGSIGPDVSDHGLLDGLGDDDHTQYHTAGRANTWLATKTLADVVDSASRLAMTSSERSKLAAIEPAATADQTGAEIVAAIDTQLGSSTWQSGGGGGGGDLNASDFNAHTILAATVDNAPAALTVGEQTVVGRITGGNIAALTATQLRTLVNVEDGADVTDATNVDAAGATMNADYNAHTILAATTDNTPAALTVGEQTVVGRITGGNIAALTATQLRTLANVEDGADVTDATNVNAAGAVMESDFNANTILAATSDNTPAPLTVGEQTLVGRITGGAITALSIAQVLTLLGLDGAANVQTATWTIGATYNPNDVVVDDDSLYLQNSGTTSTGDDPASGAPWLLLCRGITSAERSKLAAIEALADVTDATNVNAAGAVMESDYNAHTILQATSDNTPVAITVGEQTVVGRITGGNIVALSVTQLLTLLGLNGGTTDQVLGKTSGTDGAFSWRDDAGGGGYPQTLAATHEYIDGRFYPLVGPNTVPALTTQAMAANRADLQLWVPDQNVTFDQLGLYITTGVASAQAKVLVYDSDADGWPDALIYSSSALDCSTSSTFPNATTSLPTFTAGVRYWVGHIADSTATARGISATAQRSLGMAASGDAAVGYALRRTGLTFATPPNPWTWTASDVASTANTVIVIGRV